MKVLVTGGTGLLGHHIAMEASKHGLDTYATYHVKQPLTSYDLRWVKMDLTDLESIVKVIRELKPDVIVHAAAYTDVDGSEMNKELAYKTNYVATHAIARLTAKMGTFLIYISTDYVFDGERGLYREEDLPNPVNYYGLTKLLGEIAISSILEKYLIIRVSGLYGYSPTGKKNFGINALEKLLKNQEVFAFIDQYLSPTYVYYLAERIIKTLEKELTGIMHIAGERLSRFELATLLADVIGAEKSLVRPVRIEDAKFLARRPKDSSLSVDLAKELNLNLPDISDCLNHFVRYYDMEMKQHAV